MSQHCDRTIFHPDDPWTLGVELEVRLIDAETMKPANRSPYLFEHLPEELRPHVHQELLQSMVEIVTPVCRDHNEAADFVMESLHALTRIGEKEGIRLAALATHPFERKEDNRRFHDPRYEAFAEELQIVLKNFLISGLHIHVAMPDEETALRAYNASIRYLPIFLGLSANSPFTLGEDTGLQSYRSKIFERLPRAGVPEYFDRYADYCRLMEQLYATGTIQSAKDVWWDVRIHQGFGTVELRVCDAFYDRERLRLITLFYQALLHYQTQRPQPRVFFQISRQNKWNAVRHGMKGTFIEGDRVVGIRQKAHELVDEIEAAGSFEALGVPKKEIEALHELIERETIARKLRRIYEETGDFKKVIEEELIG
ncbi:carboxylate-amine ligase [Nitratifractor sp.]